MKSHRKLKRKIRRKGKQYAYYWFFQILYLAGLTFLVPFALSYNVPAEVGLWKGTQEALLAFSLFLVGFSVYGVYDQSRGKMGNTLKDLGRMSLVPGLVSLFFALFGTGVLIRFLTWLGPVEEHIPLISLYVGHSVNRAAYLTIVFILLGASLYYLGNRTR